MSAEVSRALVRRLFDEVVNGWDFTHLDELFAPDFRADPELTETAAGAEAAEQFFLWLQNAFPDLHYTIDDIVAEGDRAVARLHATGTHRGEYLGRSPHGTPVRFEELVMIRVADGRIAEWWAQGDQLGILEQIDGTTETATNPD